MQLTLYYADRAVDNGCQKLSQCAGCKETLTHIFFGTVQLLKIAGDKWYATR